MVVIKPFSAFKGDGVIIVSREDLDDTLSYILNPSSSLKKNPDRSYHHWYYNQDTKFLVEEFVTADPMPVPHLDNQLYSPTIRAVYMLCYDQQKISTQFLGGYVSLPCRALSEEGTLNEHHKSICELPFYCKADPSVMHEVETCLNEILPILYAEMLFSD